jgi:hypothetical protein
MIHGATFRSKAPSDDGYGDYFAIGTSVTEPVLMQDGTSVLFPGDWTAEDADRWRKAMRLEAPASTTPPTIQ